MRKLDKKVLFAIAAVLVAIYYLFIKKDKISYSYNAPVTQTDTAPTYAPAEIIKSINDLQR